MRNPTLVEITTSFRLAPSALPSICSDWPPVYPSAVLKWLTPASNVLPIIWSARSASTFEISANGPWPWPNVIAPKAKRETISPELPSREYCIPVVSPTTMILFVA